ncbi:hypothetical protein SKAU_G00301480 [Synaphobranchus kaupii]|uniref:Uncharacterized protein n=1 Tax=Synaphobranchus kaupii TaxID=118154 RepID=A0A9Q1IL79_SYNKA|nr:hypothetical protein SKAU_G00301480 [Synaphobranchus kaupii]
MDCNLGTVTDKGARWHKQVPVSAPHWVLQPLLSSHSNLLISQLDSKGRSHHTLTTCWGHSALSSLCSNV